MVVLEAAQEYYHDCIQSESLPLFVGKGGDNRKKKCARFKKSKCRTYVCQSLFRLAVFPLICGTLLNRIRLNRLPTVNLTFRCQIVSFYGFAGLLMCDDNVKHLKSDESLTGFASLLDGKSKTA